MVGTDARSELTGPAVRAGAAGDGVGACLSANSGQGSESPASRLLPEGRSHRRPDDRIQFAIATPADDTAIRRLLRKTPTRGAISVSFEREPAYFPGAEVGRISDPLCSAARRTGDQGRSPTCPTSPPKHTADDDQTIVAYDEGRLVCMGRCVVRPRYLNGELRRVGYLGELRLDATARRGVDILRGGYQFFRELQRDDPADFFFTSIAADNDRARRVLERGLPGVPRYEFLTEFVTVLISCRGVAWRGRVSPIKTDGLRDAAAQRPDTQATLATLNSHAARYQLAAQVEEFDLGANDELVALRDGDGHVIAVAVLADQRSWRQTVMRGYSRTLAMARPFLNLAAALGGGPRLPRVGAVVPAAFLSPLATAPGQESRLPELVRAAFAPARARGVELLTLGFAANDPRLAMVRRDFRGREYHSRLYRVRWPDETGSPLALDGRLFHPEVALL